MSSGIGEAPWDVARSTATTRHLIETAAQHGLDAVSCLSGTGLTVADLEGPATVVPAAQELAIIRNVIAALGDRPGLGLQTGARYGLADTGILGFALMASPTFGDALALACRFVALTASYLDIAAPELTGGEAIIAFDDARVPRDVRQFLVERDFAMFLRLLPMLTGADTSPTGLRLEVAELQVPDDLVALGGASFPIEVTGRNVLVCPVELVRRPMPGADTQTAAICIRQCEELLHRRRARRGVSASVRTRLIEESSRLPSMSTVARDLCVTERTLHRRLAAEGTSYRALLDEVRATLAAELLRSGLSVQQTAQRLGYSESAAFTHAYRRWNGHPPSRRDS